MNLVERGDARRREVDAWTSTRRARAFAKTLRALVEAGADQITTNDPEGLMPLLSGVA